MSLTSYRAAPPRDILVRYAYRRLERCVVLPPYGYLSTVFALLPCGLWCSPRRRCVWGCLHRKRDTRFLTRFGGDLLSHVLRRSTIGAAALNCRVRDGIGCFARAMTTKPRKKPSKSSCYYVYAFDQYSLAITGSNQAYRAISTGQLNALLRLHLRPIDVVVFHGPQGYLVLRGASRLDAFSGYPVRT
jgi:hypothetical protein